MSVAFLITASPNPVSLFALVTCPLALGSLPGSAPRSSLEVAKNFTRFVFKSLYAFNTFSVSSAKFEAIFS